MHRTHHLLTLLAICLLIPTPALKSMDDERPAKRVRFAVPIPDSSSSSSSQHMSMEKMRDAITDDEITLKTVHHEHSFKLSAREPLTQQTYRDILNNPRGALLAMVYSRVKNENFYTLYDATSPRYITARDANHVMNRNFRTYYFITPCSAQEPSLLMEEGNVPTQEDQLLLTTACEAVYGQIDAQMKLGYLYVKEFHGSERYRTAYAWFKRAAEQGNAQALCEVGNLHRFGFGTEQSYVKMLDSYRKAAAGGNRFAQYLLGELYVCGEGVVKDYKAAFDWFQRAAAIESAAQNNLGYLYEKGLGVEQDYEKAFAWYDKAAHQLLEARCNVGLMYAHGRGVQQPDIQKARSIYKKLLDQEYSPSSAELIDRFSELGAMVSEEKSYSLSNKGNSCKPFSKVPASS